MSDITPEILPRLKAYRLPGLDLDEQFVYPDYQGGSILNLPASICQWLGSEPLAALPLRPELTITPPGEIRRVILILIDARPCIACSAGCPTEPPPSGYAWPSRGS